MTRRLPSPNAPPRRCFRPSQGPDAVPVYETTRAGQSMAPVPASYEAEHQAKVEELTERVRRHERNQWRFARECMTLYKLTVFGQPIIYSERCGAWYWRSTDWSPKRPRQGPFVSRTKAVKESVRFLRGRREVLGT